jgi:hypothetical protein
MAKKEGLFERANRAREERASAEQRDRDRESNRASTGLYGRVQQAREQSGETLHRRDSQHLRGSDVRRGVTNPYSK